MGLMFRKVRDAVLAKTGGHQEPFWYGSLSSEGAYLAALPESEPEEPTPISRVTVHGGSENPETPVSPGDRQAPGTAEELAAERASVLGVGEGQPNRPSRASRPILDSYPEGTYAVSGAESGSKRITVGPEEKPDVQVAVTPDAPERVVSPEPRRLRRKRLRRSLGVETTQSGARSRWAWPPWGSIPARRTACFGRRTRVAIEQVASVERLDDNGLSGRRRRPVAVDGR